MNLRQEVIIAGGGPAGAVVAYELATRGVAVTILEKERLPRYKCCAGGLTARTALLLNADLRPAVQEATQDTIFNFRINYKEHSLVGGYYGKALAYTVMRDAFDHALLKRAQQAGAKIIPECAVSGLDTSDGSVRVKTTRGDFEAGFVVGADGARSAVAAAINIHPSRWRITGLESEIEVPPAEMLRQKSQITVGLGYVSGGYCWVFPKARHLSIGAGTLGGRAIGLKRSYGSFLESLKLEGTTVLRSAGEQLSACRGSARVTRGRVALVGDAAGLADPLTGEGIYNAILSAQLLAPVIAEALANGKGELAGYQRAVDEQIAPEMRTGYVFSRIFMRFPWLIFEILKDSRVWDAACQILLGELSYRAVAGKLAQMTAVYPVLARLRPWLQIGTRGDTRQATP